MNLVELVTSVFQRIFEASLYASALALLIEVVLKILGKRIEPRWRYALWIPVLLRFLLIPPVLPESALSLFNLPHWFRSTPPQERRVTVTWPDESQLSASEASSSTAPDVVTTESSASPSVESIRITAIQGLSIVAASVSVLLFLLYLYHK